MSEDKAELYAAIAALQGKLPRVAKGASGQVAGRKDYKYADLADISEAVMPMLSEHGLAFTALTDFRDGVFGLAYKLVHKSGQAEGGFYVLPDPRQTGPQQVGSAITYARRYSLCAATGVAPDGDDDDAGAAQGGFRSAGDAWNQASADRPRQQGGQWRPSEAAQQRAAQSGNGSNGRGRNGQNGHAPNDQPPANGTGGDDDEWVRDFMARLADASGEGLRAMRIELAKAVSAKRVGPDVANELSAAIKERAA